MGKAKKSNKKNKSTMAKQADRHHLYELSVQCSDTEIDFINKTYRKLRGHKASLLREDFCGTANVCCNWVKRRRNNYAIGIDLDPEVLDWGAKHNLSSLTPTQAKRISLQKKNVLKVKTEPVDIILAMNFSYWLLKDRKQLKKYFKCAHKALKNDGILFIDAYGGYDSFREIDEKQQIEDGGKGFTYIWDQAKFDPINHDLTCHIHFTFPDGSQIKRAFSYNWRLWTLPEIRGLLEETGYRRVTFYWQGWDKNGEADGKFKPVKKGEADAGWICYISAEK